MNSMYERIAERSKNLVSDKPCKIGIVLLMPTVHPVLLQMARTVLLYAQYPQIMEPNSVNVHSIYIYMHICTSFVYGYRTQRF